MICGVAVCFIVSLGGFLILLCRVSLVGRFIIALVALFVLVMCLCWCLSIVICIGGWYCGGLFAGVGVGAGDL